ncbi:hypothetical protein PQX77_015712 [Marasmius sp. AFHP31]|nr:hypothetical protein PQX77_015712 [Marasmius sp. AFHP31]
MANWFSLALSDIWILVVEELDVPDARAFLQVSRLANRLALRRVYRNLTVSCQHDVALFCEFFERASSPTLVGGTEAGNYVSAICVGLPEAPQTLHGSTTGVDFDYVRFLRLLTGFPNVESFCAYHIVFPLSALRDLLVSWQSLRTFELSYVTDRALSPTSLLQLSRRTNKPPRVQNVLIVEPSCAIVADTWLPTVASLLHSLTIHCLIIDWSTLERTLSFLQPRGRRIVNIDNIVLLPTLPSSGHRVQPAMRVLQQHLPNDLPIQSFLGIARLESEDGAIVLNFVGTVDDLDRYGCYMRFPCRVKCLSIASDRMSTSFVKIRSTLDRFCFSYTALTSLSIDDLCVNELDPTFGAVFPALRQLFVWTTRHLDAASFHFFAVGTSVSDDYSEDYFFDLLMEWAVDPERPSCTEFRLDETFVWIASLEMETADGVVWSRRPAKKIVSLDTKGS